MGKFNTVIQENILLKKQIQELNGKLDVALGNATVLFNERTELCFNPDSEKSKSIRENVIKKMEKWMENPKPKSKIISLNEASN